MSQFWHERAGCRRTDSFVRPTSLNYIHTMIIERLSAYRTTQKPSQWTKATVPGAIFGRRIRYLVAWLGVILAQMGRMRQCFCLPKLGNSLSLQKRGRSRLWNLRRQATMVEEKYWQQKPREMVNI